LKLVYLAGPYSPLNKGENSFVQREDFINNSRRAAIWCAENGIGYFSPHLNSAHFDAAVPHVDYEFWMEMDFLILGKCDALVLLNGWEHSLGAKRERDFALKNDIPVFQFIGDKQEILEWSTK
jgi:nucleoside 2-deoxyribosyltransferase